MKRIVTAILTATEAFAVATVGLAFIAVPALLVWLFGYQLAGEPSVVFGLISSLWFFGHGVPLSLVIDPATAASIGLPAEEIKAVFSLFPLGFMLCTALFAARAGARLVVHQLSAAAWGAGAGAVIYFILSWMLSSVAPRPPIAYDTIQTALMPTLIFSLGLVLGYLVQSIREDAEWFAQLRHQVLSQLKSGVTWVLNQAAVGMRIAGVTLATLLAVTALIFAVRLAFSYVAVVSLSQQLHVDALGTLVLFGVNLAYLPTALLWLLSWMIGPGFSIGEGSSVSALSTQLGPVPNFPLFAILPTGSNPWALSIVLLIVLSAAAAVVGVFRKLQAEGGRRPNVSELAVTLATALVASSLALVVAMWLATGSLGPGRLSITGPHPWLVGGVFALEVLVGAVLGALITYVDWERVATLTREKSQGIRNLVPAEATGALGSVAQKFRRKKARSEPSPEPRGESTSDTLAADNAETRELPDFTPWWSENDDKL